MVGGEGEERLDAPRSSSRAVRSLSLAIVARIPRKVSPIMRWWGFEQCERGYEEK